MRYILSIIAVLLCCIVSTKGEPNYAKIADCIYIVEGRDKAKKPYGILSVPVRNEAEARQVCLNTIRNNYKRWVKAGRKGDYLEFLAKRYCPLNDPRDKWGINKFWLKNLRYHLTQNKKLIN